MALTMCPLAAFAVHFASPPPRPFKPTSAAIRTRPLSLRREQELRSTVARQASARDGESAEDTRVSKHVVGIVRESLPMICSAAKCIAVFPVRCVRGALSGRSGGFATGLFRLREMFIEAGEVACSLQSACTTNTEGFEIEAAPGSFRQLCMHRASGAILTYKYCCARFPRAHVHTLVYYSTSRYSLGQCPAT